MYPKWPFLAIVGGTLVSGLLDHFNFLLLGRLGPGVFLAFVKECFRKWASQNVLSSGSVTVGRSRRYYSTHRHTCPRAHTHPCTLMRTHTHVKVERSVHLSFHPFYPNTISTSEQDRDCNLTLSQLSRHWNWCGHVISHLNLTHNLRTKGV